MKRLPSFHRPLSLAFFPRLLPAAILAILGFMPGTAPALSYREAPLADGFDFPVGKPDAFGYYKYRGFIRGDHMGEDWNGMGGANSDYGKPVYAVGHGLVVYSKDFGSNWGNVIIVRHAYREGGVIKYVDSLYGHLKVRSAALYDRVFRGEQIGTIGTNRGMYVAHLHFEIRKNINVALRHRDYAMDYSNYHNPTQFIKEKRALVYEPELCQMPVDCFGRGVQPRWIGRRLESLPELPFGKPPPRPAMDPVIKAILVRRGLYGDPDVSPVDQAEVEEREKILDFWHEQRKKQREMKPNTDPVEPDTDSVE